MSVTHHVMPTSTTWQVGVWYQGGNLNFIVLVGSGVDSSGLEQNPVAGVQP